MLTKTDRGQRVIKDRSIPLTPRQRSALILVDGKRNVEQWRASALAAGASQEDFERLFELDLVEDSTPQATAAMAVAAAAAVDAIRQHKERTPQERYAEAYPIATKLTAALGLRGFRLNLAVEAAGSYEALRDLAPKILESVGADKFAPWKTP